jgi:colanic acid/amylovoran biosynthesis protein
MSITNGRPSASIVGIMGTPVASGNRGVLALGAALARLCLISTTGAEVRLFGSHSHAGTVIMRPEGRELAIPMVHWRLSPRGGLRHHLFVIVAGALLYRVAPWAVLRRRLADWIPWISALEKTDLVGDVRGGDSFSDIYGLKRLLLASLPVLSVIWVKRSLVLFPQTYGPFKSRTSRWIARWIIRNSTTIIARDKESQRVAQELAAPGQKILLTPDVAFALYADVMQTALFDNCAVPEPIPDNCIGLNVNGLMFNGGYTGKNMFGLKLDYRAFLSELARTLLEIHPGPLLLVPHTYAPFGDIESDNEACHLLKESLPVLLRPRVRIVTGSYDAHQLKGIISRCGFFVGSRMHSCIAALSQGVPCVGVAYSMKFRGVFDSVGMADWVVDGRTTGTEDAVASIAKLYHERNARQPELARQAAANKTALQDAFASLLGRPAINQSMPY